MKVTYKDTTEAPVKWWAAQDARMRNIANKSRWDSKIHLKVESMKSVLDYIYSGKIYEAYRVRSVAIKIDHPTIKDRRMLKEAERAWEAEGIIKTVTPQGVLYRIA